MQAWGKVKAAAEHAGMKERTVRDWMKAGLKYSRMPSGTVLIKFSDLDEFLESYQVNEDRINDIADGILKELK